MLQVYCLNVVSLYSVVVDFQLAILFSDFLDQTPAFFLLIHCMFYWIVLRTTCCSTALPYCTDRKSIDYSKQVDFVVLLYDGHGGLQSGGMVATYALRGSPVGGLDVAVNPGFAEPDYKIIAVRVNDRCSGTWLITRHAFTIRGAAEIKIVIGDVIVLNWVNLFYSSLYPKAKSNSILSRSEYKA